MGWTGGRSQEIVPAADKKERATPIGVDAGVGDVLAGDPDRVPVHSSRAEISPTRPRRVAHLRFIAGKPVVLRGSAPAGDVVPQADTAERVNPRIGGAWGRGVTGGGEQ